MVRRSICPPRSSAWRATLLAAMLAGGVGPGRPVGAQDTAAAARSRFARVIGVVVDSLHGTSLANAVVEIEGASRSGRTDAVGSFRIDSVLPGKFRLGVFHPLLDSIGVGIASPLLTARAGDSLLITLATPSAPTLAALACRDVPAPVGTLANPQTTGPGVVMGRVLDADTDEPVPNVVVAYTWMEIEAGKQIGFHRTRHTRDALTGAGGDFHLCHLPLTLTGALHAGRRDGGAAAAVSAVSRDLSPDGHVLTLVTLHLPALSTVTIADLAATAAAPDSASPAAGPAPSSASPPPAATPSIAPAVPPPGRAPTGARSRDSTAGASGRALARPQVRRYAVGTAVLTGKVIDPQARPVVSARVYVMGAADSAQTDDNGQFALHNLPSGSRTIVVRAVGFEPVTQPVELTIREPLHVVVPFTARAVPVLKPVQVVARLDAGLKNVGFAQRQKIGMGTFWTLPDIEKHKAYDFHDLFTTFPGLRVDYNEQGQASLMATRGAGGCLGYNSSGQATPGANCGPCVAYVVDGSPFTENQEGEMDTYVHPGDIGAIEVYQPNSVPRSIAGVTQGDCLNIIVWTKAKLGV